MLDAVLNIVVAFVPAALVGLVCWRLSRKSKEEWAVMAWAPILPQLLLSIKIAWDTTRDRTSHNLWPLEVIFWMVPTAVMFTGFLLGRYFLGEGEPPRRR